MEAKGMMTRRAHSQKRPYKEVLESDLASPLTAVSAHEHTQQIDCPDQTH
jgi:hypothetical protein